MNKESKLLETGPSPRGWHRLQTVLECPQKFAFKYLLDSERQRKHSPALTKGSMMHLALAHHYLREKCVQHGENPEEWLNGKEALRASAEKNPEESEWLDLISDCYDAYCDRWRTDTFKVLEVEQLAYTKIDDYLFTGRLDLIVEDGKGRVYVIDHKTTTRIMASQAKYYGISGQLVGYGYMAHQIYAERYHGVMLNQIQHTGTYKFKRISLPPAPNLYRKFPQTVRDAEETIERLEKSGRSPVDYPMVMNELSCYHRYGACEFLDTCKWGMRSGE